MENMSWAEFLEWANNALSPLKQGALWVVQHPGESISAIGTLVTTVGSHPIVMGASVATLVLVAYKWPKHRKPLIDTLRGAVVLSVLDWSDPKKWFETIVKAGVAAIGFLSLTESVMAKDKPVLTPSPIIITGGDVLNVKDIKAGSLTLVQEVDSDGKVQVTLKFKLSDPQEGTPSTDQKSDDA